MAEETQAEQAEEATEPKTFTQEQVDEIVAKRLARAKSTPPADYEELKAKAAKYDEAQEAAKSELERATEERDKWKARYEEMKADAERRDAISEAAERYKVDASMLARMSGDVEENAKFLAERAENAPKYPNVRDEGERSTSSVADLEARIASEKDPAKRVDLRAELISMTRK